MKDEKRRKEEIEFREDPTRGGKHPNIAKKLGTGPYQKENNLPQNLPKKKIEEHSEEQEEVVVDVESVPSHSGSSADKEPEPDSNLQPSAVDSAVDKNGDGGVNEVGITSPEPERRNTKE